MKKKRNITSRRLIFTFGLTSILLFANLISIVGHAQNSGKLNVDANWKDLISSRKTAISQLPTYATYPLYATNWTDYAEKSIIDLLTFDESWFIEPATGIKGFRPYVKGADGWGGEDWTRDTSELISTIDVIWPLYRYLQLHPNATRQAEVEEFMENLPEYYWIREFALSHVYL